MSWPEVNPESWAPVTEEIPIEFPVRVRPFVNVKRSEKSPVVLLYEIPPVAEREVRDSLLLKVFQSVDESHPLAVVLDCTIEFCLLLKVFQSIGFKSPVAVADAMGIALCVTLVTRPWASVVMIGIMVDDP
jgi:hypothetical protein